MHLQMQRVLVSPSQGQAIGTDSRKANVKGPEALRTLGPQQMETKPVLLPPEAYPSLLPTRSLFCYMYLLQVPRLKELT